MWLISLLESSPFFVKQVLSRTCSARVLRISSEDERLDPLGNHKKRDESNTLHLSLGTALLPDTSVEAVDSGVS